MPGENVIATVREPIFGNDSILETWSPDLLSQLTTRTIPWSDIRVTDIASNVRGTTAIAGRTSVSIQARVVDPEFGFATPPMSTFLLETALATTRVVRLRVLSDNMSLTNPIVALTDGTQPNQVNLRRAASMSQPPVLLASSALGTAVGDDLLELSGSRLVVTSRCEGLCTLGSLMNPSGAVGPTPRLGAIPFAPASNGFQAPTTLMTLTDSAGMISFPNTSRIRLATDETAFVYTCGQLPMGVLQVERRALSNLSYVTSFTSSGALTLVDVMKSPRPDTVLVLATVNGPGVTFAGNPIPYSVGAGVNVVLLRIEAMQPPSITTWDRPGDQRAVGFVHTINPGFAPENRVIIIGDQGTDAFIWSVLHP